MLTWIVEVSHPQKPASQFYTCEMTHLENEIIFWDSLKSTLTQMWKPYIVVYLHDHQAPSLAPQRNRSKQENQASQLHNWALVNDIHNDDDDDDEKYSTYYSIGNTQGKSILWVFLLCCWKCSYSLVDFTWPKNVGILDLLWLAPVSGCITMSLPWRKRGKGQ